MKRWKQRRGPPGNSWKRVLACALISGVMSQAVQSDSYAAFDRVVTWSDMSALDLRPVLHSQYASPGNLLEPVVNPSAFEIALGDADHLVNPEFQVPSQLRPVVEFWLKIYTEYSTQNVVIFDSKHPEMVYEVLDFRELARTARNGVVYEILRKKRVERSMAIYRAAVLRLARSRRKPLSKEQLNVLSAMKSLRRPDSFREMARNVRAQTGQRDNIIKGLLAAESYFPRMDDLFRGFEVPVDLTRISLVESSFDLSANSRVGAAGVWQLMPGSGRKFLTVDYARGIDERRSPLKSTVAAAKMLRQNYRIFGNWALAVTAYNHGMSGLLKYRGSRAPHDFKEIAHLFDPCSRHSPLGWAGRNYYAEFLAVLHAEAYRKLFYGTPPASNRAPIGFMRLARRETPLELAKEHGVSILELSRTNPDILNPRRPLPAGFWVALPGESDDLAGLLFRSKRSRSTSSAVQASRRLKKA